MQALRDYSFATMLCLVEIAPAREAFAITAHKDDFDLLVAEAWVDILISLADRDEHPVLRMDHDHIHVWKHDRKTKSYRLYAGMYHLDLPSLSAPRYSRQTLSIIRSNDNSDQDPDEDPASLLARLKSLGESETSVREMACGLLRGSAYAIDWILEEYGGT
jgi:hypothetical protein